MWIQPDCEATPLNLSEVERAHFAANLSLGSLCSHSILYPYSKNDFASAPAGGDIVEVDLVSSTPNPLPSVQPAGLLSLSTPTEEGDWDLARNPSATETSLVFEDAVPGTYPLPTPPTVGFRHRLRNPSCDMLGIAAAPLDNLARSASTLTYGQIGDDFFASGAGAAGYESRSCLPYQQVEQLARSGEQHETFVRNKYLALPFQPDVAILTPPPDDTTTLNWFPSLGIVTDSVDQSSSASPPQALLGNDELAETSSPTTPASAETTENGSKNDKDWVDTAFLAIGRPGEGNIMFDVR